jgi:acetyl esterase/lipase
MRPRAAEPRRNSAATDMATRTDASRRLGRLHGHLAAGTPRAAAAGGGELYHSEHADDRDVFYLWPPGQVPGALPDDRGEDYLPQHAPLIAAGTLAASKRYNFERWGDSHLWRGADRPAVRVFRPDPSLQTGSAVIIAPGGGFVNLPPHEGDQIAEWLAAHGVTAFLLRYRLVSSGYPLFTQLRDMQRAIRLVRFHAARWMLDKTRIGVLGVSGGGHVATGTSVWYDLPDPTLDPADPIDAVSARPDACVLAYPLTDPVSRRPRTWAM